MKEYPILFSGEMIRAILEGRKTQTRRVIKPQSFKNPGGAIPIEAIYEREVGLWWAVDTLGKYDDPRHDPSPSSLIELRCPYGIPGDRLWVRETFALARQYNDMSPLSVCALQHEAGAPSIWYRADGSSNRCLGSKPGRWRPSIHMPKRLARIWLEITDVRVEWLRSITVADAEAEGAPKRRVATATDLKAWLTDTWDSLNAKRGYGWDANPWVWVIEFSPIAGLEDR